MKNTFIKERNLSSFIIFRKRLFSESSKACLATSFRRVTPLTLMIWEAWTKATAAVSAFFDKRVLRVCKVQAYYPFHFYYKWMNSLMGLCREKNFLFRMPSVPSCCRCPAPSWTGHHPACPGVCGCCDQHCWMEWSGMKWNRRIDYFNWKGPTMITYSNCVTNTELTKS